MIPHSKVCAHKWYDKCWNSWNISLHCDGCLQRTWYYSNVHLHFPFPIRWVNLVFCFKLISENKTQVLINRNYLLNKEDEGHTTDSHSHTCSLPNLHVGCMYQRNRTWCWGINWNTYIIIASFQQYNTHIQYTHCNLQNNRLSIHWIYSKNRYNVYIYCLHLYYDYMLPRIATT